MKIKKSLLVSLPLVIGALLAVMAASSVGAVGAEPPPPPPPPAPAPEPPPPSPSPTPAPSPTPSPTPTPTTPSTAPRSTTTPVVNPTVTAGDTTAPTISDITVTDLTETSAVVHWTTSESADSVVEFGDTANYGQTSRGEGTTNSHSVTIKGLSAGDTYHFRVKSRDSAGNEAVSEDQTLTTKSLSQDLPVGPATSETKGLNPLLWLLALAALVALIAFVIFMLWNRRRDDDDKKKAKHPKEPEEVSDKLSENEPKG